MNDQSVRRYLLLLLITDALAALLALRAATHVYTLLFHTTLPASVVAPWTPLFALVALLLGIWSTRGYYLPRIFRIAEEIAALFFGSIVATGVLGGFLYFIDRDVPRAIVLMFGFIAPSIAFLLRVSWRQLFKYIQAPRLPTSRVLVIGAGALGRQIGAQLEARSWLGLRLVGYVDDYREGQPTLGELAELESLCSQQKVDVVIVALPLEQHGQLAEVLERIHKLPVQVKLVPDMYPLAYLYSRLEMFGGMPLVGLTEPVIAPWQAAVKRALDVILSLSGLILLSPFMFSVALAVRLSSPGPIIFSHERVGEGGKLFQMYKFRTMVRDAEQMLLEQARTDEAALVKRANDPRVTPLGYWLRRFSIDELPQLWNVLRGDMSIVGPRPELPYLVERYEPWQRKRLLVPQGITGWWQINGRSDKPLLLHTEDDLYYIRNYSLLLDLEILWKTVWVVLRGKGAY